MTNDDDYIECGYLSTTKRTTIEDDITDALKEFAGSQYPLYPREVWIMRALNRRRTLEMENARLKLGMALFVMLLFIVIFTR